MFANLNHDASYDGDNDGVTAEERQFGFCRTQIKDDFMEGFQYSSIQPRWWQFWRCEELSSSDPPGLLTSSEMDWFKLTPAQMVEEVMVTTFPMGNLLESAKQVKSKPWSEPGLIEHERGQNGHRQILSGK